MPDRPHEPARVDRRAFLRTAGVLAAGAAAAGCDVPSTGGDAGDAAGGAGSAARAASTPGKRDVAFDRATLVALGEVVLPGELGAEGRGRAVDEFVAWAAGYEPVAEEMHGYGYPEVRYLPPDPAPGWRAQIDGLDLLARRSRGRPFAELPLAPRRAMVEAALARVPADELPAPIAAGHVALALLAHWASSPAAWDLAYGARIAPRSCRPLGDAPRRPLPLAPSAPRARGADA
jgi:hypothetical protein